MGLEGVVFPLKAACISGDLLSPVLLLDIQVKTMARHAYYQLRLLGQLQIFLEKKAFFTVMLWSHPDLSNMFYNDPHVFPTFIFQKTLSGSEPSKF